MNRWGLIVAMLALSAPPARGEDGAGEPPDAPAEAAVPAVSTEPSGPVGSLDPTALRGPTGRQSPCDWLVSLREGGASMDQLIEVAAARHELFTSKDLQCLRQESFHKRVVEAAKGPSLQDRLEDQRAEAAERMEAERAEAAQRLNDALVGRYDIELVGVVVAPAKQDGKAWDGFGTVPSGVVRAILALGTGGVTTALGTGEIGTYLANAALTGTSAPDVFGYAQLLGPDVPTSWSTSRLSLLAPTDPAQDAYFATFPNSPAFTGIHLAPGDAVRLTLYDADLQEHDAIGTVDIGYADLMKAAELQTLAQLPAASQTVNQVVLVQFAVRPAHDPTPRMRGQVFE